MGLDGLLLPHPAQRYLRAVISGGGTNRNLTRPADYSAAEIYW